MLQEPTQYSCRDTPWGSERFAQLIESSCDAIVASYHQRLEETGHPVIGDPAATSHVMRMGAQVVADVAASVRAGRVTIGDIDMLTSSSLGEEQARTRLTPVDSLNAAREFFGVMTSWLAGQVQDEPCLMPSFVVAILAVNESSTLKVKGMTAAYTGTLLDRIHQAHLHERHRIARELHDRLGEGLSTALRQFELAEIAQAGGQGQSEPLPSSLSRDVLVETMLRLGSVICDLRQDPVTSLEKALTQYLEAVSHDVTVRLRVSGDERWAPPIVIDESYLIIREAIRNVFAHAKAQTLLIGVNLAPHELRARVEDDGRGFVVPRRFDVSAARMAGLASMRERAVLIGGRLTILSGTGHGTQVMLHVPLPGGGDA